MSRTSTAYPQDVQEPFLDVLDGARMSMTSRTSMAQNPRMGGGVKTPSRTSRTSRTPSGRPG